MWLWIWILRAEIHLNLQTDGQPDPLPGWVDGWMGWGDEEQDTGWGRLEKVGEVKAGRVHPSSPIGQAAQRVLCRFEALKWTEFHHGHGDCSMSFVRKFGEMVLKTENVAPRLECRVLYLQALAGSFLLLILTVTDGAGDQAATN